MVLRKMNSSRSAKGNGVPTSVSLDDVRLRLRTSSLRSNDARIASSPLMLDSAALERSSSLSPRPKRKAFRRGSQHSRRNGSVFARTVKVTLLGQGGVGKSALTVQFISHRFLGEYDPTIEDSYVKHFSVDMEPARIEIFDTAGRFQDSTSMARERYLTTSDAFIVVYSITDASSYLEALEIIDWLRKKRRHSRDARDSVIALVGNKSDLDHHQEVPEEAARERATERDCLFYFTNAAEGHNGIDDVFSGVVRAVRREEDGVQRILGDARRLPLAAALGVKRTKRFLLSDVRQTRSEENLSSV